MSATRLQVIFEGPGIAESGMLLDDLNNALNHFQLPGYLMAARLTGAVSVGGQAPARICWNDGPPLPETEPGSLAFEIEVTPPNPRPADGGGPMQVAVEWVADWRPAGKRPPSSDAWELSRLWADLSPEITMISLCNPTNGHRVNIGRGLGQEWPAPGPAVSESAPATLYGKLTAVDWETRTARLQRYWAAPVLLRFGPALDEEMQRAARQRVEVQGQGRCDENGGWAEVQVEQITDALANNKPFDLEAFRNDPNPKIFDSAKVIRASEPFDVDEMIRAIHEGRGKQWPQQ